MTLATARSLIGAHGTVSKDTKKFFLVKLTPQELTQFLPTLPLLNDAHFTGKVWTFGGRRPGKIMREMTFDKIEFKYNKSTSLLALRLQLFRGF